MSVKETYRIIDCLDISEYNALSDANKDFLRIVISAKVVNLDEGSQVRTKLWNIFPEGSVTGDKMRDSDYGLVGPPYTPNP